MIGDGYCLLDGEKMTYDGFTAMFVNIHRDFDLDTAKTVRGSITNWKPFDECDDSANIHEIMSGFWSAQGVW